MQWKVSENVIEEKLLSDEWTKMSESDVEIFLATPGLGVVEAKETLQKPHGNIPECLEGAQKSSPDAENTKDVAGTNVYTISEDLNKNSYNFFDEIEMDDEFIIHSDPKYYGDSVYNRFYTSDFSNDLFF